MNPSTLAALEHIVGKTQTFTDPKVLETFSKDQYAFSPVLLELLLDKRADAVVAPSSSAELLEVVKICVRDAIPITLRGAGSGNYGQAVPLHGGVVVSFHRMNRIVELDGEARTARVEAGVRMGALERAAREVGCELRMYPSTWATATVGGFVGGGFGGVGSIEHGTLWDGLILEATVLTIEAEPQILTLAGWDALPIIHAYGTTALILDLKIALAPLTNWEEAVFSFESLEGAIGFALEVARNPSFKKREIGVHEWPIPQYFRPLVGAGGVRENRHQVMLEVPDGVSSTLEPLALAQGGSLDWHNSAVNYHKSGAGSSFNLSDFSWNHTTLWAQKFDATLTYTQVRFEAEKLLEQVHTIKQKYGDEVLMHLELIRENLGAGGTLVAGSLPIIRFSTAERLFEIQTFLESIGVQVADPHTFYLDGDSRWSGEVVLEGVKKFNPLGLLNPGKIRALEADGESSVASSWFVGTAK